ncbi:hypothetical protein Tco_1248256, partial [Tanacetum coccineum]
PRRVVSPAAVVGGVMVRNVDDGSGWEVMVWWVLVDDACGDDDNMEMKVGGGVACRCGRRQVTRKWRRRPNEGGRGDGDVEDRGDGGVGVAWTGCGGRKSRRRWETWPEK